MIILIGFGVLIFGASALYGYKNLSYKVRKKKLKQKISGGYSVAVLPELLKLIEKNSEDLELQYLLAEDYIASEMFHKAIRQLENVIRANRQELVYDNKMLVMKLADSFSAIGDYKAAQGSLLLTLEKMPLDFELVVKVADLFEKRKMQSHTVDYLKKALLIDPKNGKVLMRLATIQEKAGLLRGALKYAKQVEADDDCYADACRMIAKIYFVFSNYRQSSEYYSKLILFPGFKVEGLIGKGDVLLAENNLDGAVFLFKKALKLLSNDNNASLPILYKLAMLHLKKKEGIKGIDYLERIEAISPDYKDIKDNLKKYRDFRLHNNLSWYAFMNNKEFITLCEKVMTKMGFEYGKHKIVKKKNVVFYGVNETDGKRETVYLYFGRHLKPITDWELKEIISDMRLTKVSRGFVFSLSNFSAEGKDYAETQNLRLVAKQELNKILELVKGPQEAIA